MTAILIVHVFYIHNVGVVECLYAVVCWFRGITSDFRRSKKTMASLSFKSLLWGRIPNFHTLERSPYNSV